MDIKPLAVYTKTLRILLKLNLALAVIALVTGLYDYHSYSNLSPDINLEETVLPSDVTVSIVYILQAILFIIAGIAFLQWIYYTNKNLHVLSNQELEFTPGWSVGWYFIPIANLFKPYQSMKEIWRLCHKNESVSYAIVGWWWCFWIVSNFLERLAFKFNLRAGSAQQLVASAGITAASDVSDIILNIVALMLVTRIGISYSKSFGEQEPALERDPRATYPLQ